MTTLVLPYPISSNRYWATRVVPNKQTGKPMALVYVTAEANAYKESVRIAARAGGLRIPLDGRVAVHVQLFPRRPLDWAKRAQRNPDTWDDDVQCIDLDNANKVLIDALNKIAWIDDKQVRKLMSERMEPDGEGRVVVTIEAIKCASVAPALFDDVPQPVLAEAPPF